MLTLKTILHQFEIKVGIAIAFYCDLLSVSIQSIIYFLHYLFKHFAAAENYSRSTYNQLGLNGLWGPAPNEENPFDPTPNPKRKSRKFSASISTSLSLSTILHDDRLQIQDKSNQKWIFQFHHAKNRYN